MHYVFTPLFEFDSKYIFAGRMNHTCMLRHVPHLRCFEVATDLLEAADEEFPNERLALFDE